jgi:hypothetical protein
VRLLEGCQEAALALRRHLIVIPRWLRRNRR